MAFLTLYDQYFPLLFRYCRQITPATQLIEDTIHDLFVYLWDHKQNINDISSVRAYLISSVRRRLLKEMKNESKELIVNDTEATAFEFMFDSDLESGLRQKMLELSEKQREVLYLKFYNNLSFQEIAEIMDITIDAVYKIAKRSLHKLKKKLIISGLVKGSLVVGMYVIIRLLYF
ncbi:MAG: sigma-70 family RNA polymerase sigma factor [Cyclobacteriaceae bacterium]|nr:sigma-70 family RNA polymerase sigma factor [Cyclobacteriaceae bacterium]